MSKGLLRELSPGPLAPEARIMPLEQAASCRYIVQHAIIILHHEADVMTCGNPCPGDYGHHALPAAPLPPLQLAKYLISVPSQT
jgi:hypothetical protein